MRLCWCHSCHGTGFVMGQRHTSHLNFSCHSNTILTIFESCPPSHTFPATSKTTQVTAPTAQSDEREGEKRMLKRWCWKPLRNSRRHTPDLAPLNSPRNGTCPEPLGNLLEPARSGISDSSPVAGPCSKPSRTFPGTCTAPYRSLPRTWRQRAPATARHFSTEAP